jgi:hypothetical protein
MSLLMSEVTRLILGGRLLFERLLSLMILMLFGEGTTPAALQDGDVGGESSSSIDDPNDGSGTPVLASSLQKAMLKVNFHNQ